jgi:hypothetical protein
MLEKHEMEYEMKRIEKALPGAIKPPRGYGRGRKWIVETMIPRVSYAFPSRIRMEINFTHPRFITVVTGIDLIGGIPGFLSKKYVGTEEMMRIHDIYYSAPDEDKVVFRKKSWKMRDGNRRKFRFCLHGPFGGQFVLFAIENVEQFRVLMHVMLKVDLHQALKRLVQQRASILTEIRNARTG